MVMEHLPMLFHAAGGEGSVAVWPASATGFVDECQLLTESEWQRLLRVGLRLGPDARVKELYCFRNVPTTDGLSVRVLRLVQTTQTRSSSRWKIVSEAKAPPRRVHNINTKSISPEEKQRKRCKDKEEVDEVRLPLKTRRLSVSGAKSIAGVAPVRFDTVSKTPAAVSTSTEPFDGRASESSLVTTLKRVIAAGLAVDSDDEGDDRSKLNNAQMFSRPAPGSCTLTLLRDVLESASTQVCRAVNGLRNVSSMKKMSSATDSDDYDLLWTEEKYPLRWTMFGEPNISRNSAVDTRSRRREARHTRSTWKFW